MATINVDAKTQIAMVIVARANEKTLTIQELAKECSVSYEHMRKTVNGLVVPSNFVIRELARVLGLNRKDLEELAVADKLRHKYGGIPEVLAGKNPELANMERLWPHLTEDQKKDINIMVEALARRNSGTSRSK